LVGQVIGACSKPYQFQRFVGACAMLCSAHAGLVHRDLDILGRSECWDQVMGLEDEPDHPPAELIDIAHLRERNAANQYLAAGWSVECAN
jgi:hypothetical protein